MKPFVVLYCEGSETKLCVLSIEKEGIKLINTASVRAVDLAETPMSSSSDTDFSMEDMGEGIDFDKGLDEEAPTGDMDSSDIPVMTSHLGGIKLSQTQFLPVLTEPVINYHIYDGEIISDKSKQLDAIISDILDTKGISVRKDFIDFIDFSENSKLAVFIEGDIPCVDTVNALAEYNNRRYLKIAGLKSAELSLAYYVSKSTKFFPEDFSLIIYTGKEYSKLIFLEGQKIKHIGSTLDIGTQNLQTYDVYFSKILLEMENGGIPRLDNVILCGEDNSENLILSFYGTFPEANVSELKFDSIDLSEFESDEKDSISSYAIPIAAAMEYLEEEKKQHSGINILPRFIKENQKPLQFSWHSYVILFVLFAVTFGLTLLYLSKSQEMKSQDAEILRLSNLQSENQLIMDEMKPLQERIAGFGETQAILDSATLGTEIYWKMLEKVSDFIERRRNFWVTKMQLVGFNEMKVTGYSLSRSVLTEFADYNDSSLLQSVLYDPLREKNAFQYTLTFNLYNESLEVNGP